MRAAGQPADPPAAIDRALVTIRRDQQRRRLQRQGDPAESPAQSLASAAKFRFLDALDGAPVGLSISEIADVIGVDQPRASRLTAELVDELLVAREPDARDGRRSVISLRQRGRDVIAAATGRRREAIEQALGGFSEDERIQFARLLTRFTDAWPR